jgi:hypothetical protein
VIFVALVLLVSIGLQQPLLNSDGDLARHLRHGQYMLEHHALIRADPFSYTRPGQPFVAFEYGSQLLYALAERLGGLPGVAILAALLLATTYGLLAGFLLRRGVDPLLAYFTVVLAALVGAGHWLARPHLFTYLFVVVLLELLEREPRPPVLLFGVLFAVWANVHGGFVYGLTLIGVYLCGSVAEMLVGGDRHAWAKAARFYAAAGLIGFVATLLTPNGLRLHQHIEGIFGLHYLMDHTQEFTSPDFHDPGPKFFLGAILLCVTGMALVRSRPTLPRLLLFCLGTAWGLIAWRNVALFGLTALPVLALHLDPAWRELPDPRGVRSRFANTARTATTAIWVTPVALGMIILAVSHGRIGQAQLIEDHFDRTAFPVAAVSYARTNGIDGRIFSEFTWNGYLEYAWPAQKIFIDGGTDFFGEDLFREYATVKHLGGGWRDVLRRWNVSTLMVRRESSLAREAIRGGDWPMVYCDSLAVLLRRAPDPAPMGVAQADSAERALDACRKAPA